jgi:N-acetylneuraminate synthase
MEITKQLIDMAKDAGCDAVKFQKRTIDIVYTPAVLDTPRESPWGTTTREQKMGLEFGVEEYKEIDRYCKEKKIEWFASAWDVESQKFLKQFNCKYNKIASAMLTHIPLLKEVASEKLHTFISTGMATYAEIDAAVAIFKEANCPFTLMHTVSVYPCPEEDLNLNMIKTLSDKYKCPVGYSGHETSPVPSIAAAAMGITALERHITLDRTMYGSDQSASLEKRGLEILVSGVRSVEKALGKGQKEFGDAEKAVAAKLRYW